MVNAGYNPMQRSKVRLTATNEIHIETTNIVNAKETPKLKQRIDAGKGTRQVRKRINVVPRDSGQQMEQNNHRKHKQCTL